ncbi:MAG TPA: hypothetical protein VFP39_12695 [Gemmatimonadales bacterium]|nr:hypothetical protein [Gemmatimonadales bacterium]
MRAPAPWSRIALVCVVVGAVACSSTSSTAPHTLTFTRNPCLPSDTVQLAAAATLRLDCSNGGTTVTFAGGGASYLIVPEFATDQAPFQLVDYSVASGNLSPAAAVRGRVAADVQRLRTRPLTAQRMADRYLREEGRDLARSGALRRPAVRAPSLAISAAPDTIHNFQVLSNFTTGAFANVTGRLAYSGTNLLLYIDTLSPSGFSAAELQTFGQYFDQTLWAIDTTAFGQPSDVDQNGHVIMLMSKVVNADTPSATCATQGYVAGFFNPQDFDGPSDPHSNQGEIFYSVVPDPNGTFSCGHTVADVGFAVPSVFLHELQHLISFSQHVVVGGGQAEASWLDEGQSIAAEELGSLYYENRCPPPSCRTDPSQLFPDSSQGFVQSFLYDSYQFGLLPDTASITLESDDQQGDSWRGGAWLLVRWLVDQGGAGMYRQLERGPAGGVADIEQATGRPFPALFADFGLALYTDSLPGLPRTTAPAVDRFTTRNLRQLWARLFTTSGPSTNIPLPMPVQLFAVTGDTSTAVLYPGTVTYFRLDTPASSAAVSVRFAAPGGAAFSATLNPQLAVFRLPAGQ